MTRFGRAIDNLNEWTSRIFSPAILVMMAIGTFEVVARYFFNRPTIWAWEVNEHLLILFLSLAGGYTLMLGRHVSVDLLYMRLKPRVRAILDSVTWLFFFLVCVVVIWQGTAEAWESTLKGERALSSFSSPVYPDKWMIPIGGVLLLLQGIVRYARNIMIILKKDMAAT